jgi:hypothetical protein
VIARAGGSNVKFRKVFQAKSKPYRHQIDNDQLSDALSNKLMAEVYAEALIQRVDTLVDGETSDAPKVWKQGALILRDKGLVEASAENVVQLLLDLPDLFRDLQSMANKASNYRRQEEAADSGN